MECFPLNDNYILITIEKKIYLFDIKYQKYKLLTSIHYDNDYYKTINITKYYNNNNTYHFIILSCKGYPNYGDNLLSYSFELIIELNNKYKFNLNNNNMFSSQKINLNGCRDVLNGTNNHIILLMH